MLFYIVLTPISTTSGLWSTDNTRKYHQIDTYIYQCGLITEVILGLTEDNILKEQKTKFLEQIRLWYSMCIFCQQIIQVIYQSLIFTA